MHAYLIISKDNNSLEREVLNITKSEKFNLVEFPVQKIEDARNLNSFIKFSISKKTAVLIKNFQDATEECVNAILKNLEEPQDNLIFIIHAKSENSLLPTIRSRCQIIHTSPILDKSNLTEIEEFIKMDLIGRSDFLSRQRKREDATTLSEKFLEYYSNEISKYHNIKLLSEKAKSAIILNKSLKLNGNVNLQLLRFLADISN
jgi:DNA polymerase-3 subunit delta'